MTYYVADYDKKSVTPVDDSFIVLKDKKLYKTIPYTVEVFESKDAAWKSLLDLADAEIEYKTQEKNAILRNAINDGYQTLSKEKSVEWLERVKN